MTSNFSRVDLCFKTFLGAVMEGLTGFTAGLTSGLETGALGTSVLGLSTDDCWGHVIVIVCNWFSKVFCSVLD